MSVPDATPQGERLEGDAMRRAAAAVGVCVLVSAVLLRYRRPSIARAQAPAPPQAPQPPATTNNGEPTDTKNQICKNRKTTWAGLSERSRSGPRWGADRAGRCPFYQASGWGATFVGGRCGRGFAIY